MIFKKLSLLPAAVLPLATFLLILTLFSSCSKNEPIPIIEDYEDIFTKDESRLYSYSRTFENDTMFMEFRTVYENGIKYVTERSYTNQNKLADRKFKIISGKKELIEYIHYYQDSPSSKAVPLQVELTDYKSTPDDGKYYIGEYAFKMTMPDNMKSSIQMREVFEKDTVTSWGNEEIPTLKWTSTTKTRTFYRYLPFLGESAGYQSLIYYTKGVGITKTVYQGKDYYSVWKLIGFTKIDPNTSPTSVSEP